MCECVCPGALALLQPLGSTEARRPRISYARVGVCDRVCRWLLEDLATAARLQSKATHNHSHCSRDTLLGTGGTEMKELPGLEWRHLHEGAPRV